MTALSSLLLIDSTQSWTMTGKMNKKLDNCHFESISQIRYRIVVLDNGRIVEYDPPSELLANRKSLFFSMAKDAGLAA